MIEVKNVKKEFTRCEKKNIKDKFLAVNDISFTAKEGQIVGILGPNGAGKTTLLRIVAGIMEQTAGDVLIDGLKYSDHEIEIKKSMAYLSGNTKLYNSITPYELLKMCGGFYEVSSSELEKRIEEITKVLRMGKFLHNKISNLSTGQTQRVNIARCLVHNPKYYVLDEATNGLDIISSQVILDFIKGEKKKGKCILYSTHYMEEAENICDIVVMVNHGQIIFKGTPKEILAKTKTTNLRDSFFKLIGDSNNEE